MNLSCLESIRRCLEDRTEPNRTKLSPQSFWRQPNFGPPLVDWRLTAWWSCLRRSQWNQLLAFIRHDYRPTLRLTKCRLDESIAGRHLQERSRHYTCRQTVTYRTTNREEEEKQEEQEEENQLLLRRSRSYYVVWNSPAPCWRRLFQT